MFVVEGYPPFQCTFEVSEDLAAPIGRTTTITPSLVKEHSAMMSAVRLELATQKLVEKVVVVAAVLVVATGLVHVVAIAAIAAGTMLFVAQQTEYISQLGELEKSLNQSKSALEYLRTKCDDNEIECYTGVFHGESAEGLEYPKRAFANWLAEKQISGNTASPLQSFLENVVCYGDDSEQSLASELYVKFLQDNRDIPGPLDGSSFLSSSRRSLSMSNLRV